MSKLKQLLFSLNETDRRVIEEKLKEKDQKIDQLKQQLDESFTEEDVNGLIEDRDKTIKFLQKELAEKDKEIESLKQQLEETNAGYDFIYEQSRETIKELKQNQTQLAIQELEKVKDLLLIENKNNPIVYDLNDYTRGGALDRDKTFEIIDQQIKKLKGERDVKD